MNREPILPAGSHAGQAELLSPPGDTGTPAASAGFGPPRPTLVSIHGQPLATPPDIPAPLPEPRLALAADALRLALDEGHVYAAMTGVPGVGKTEVLEAVLAAATTLRVLRIKDPGAVTDRLAAQIEQVALAEASKPDADRHIALVVDDAHLASVELLDALSRMAAVRRAGGRLPQVLLVGQPLLWDRLKAERFRPLERRLAIRHELPAGSTTDAWSAVEQALAPRPAPPAVDSPDIPAPAAAAVARPAAPPPRAARPRTAAPATFHSEPGNRIDDLVARRAELVMAADDSRRAPRLVIAALLVVAVATIGLAVAVQLGNHPLPLPPADQPSQDQAGATRQPPLADTAQPRPAALASSAPTSDATAPTPPGLAAASLPALPAPSMPGLSMATTAAQPASLPQAVDPQASSISNPASLQTAIDPPAAAQPAPSLQSAAILDAPPRPASAQNAASIAASNAASNAAPTQVSSSATAPGLSPEVVALMIRRGEERLSLGDIAAARSFFERIASTGNGRAALLAARTYDRAALPAEAAGMADPRQALDWYRRAAAAGDPAAATRLQQLGATPR